MIFENGIIKTPKLEFDETCGGIGKGLIYKRLKQYHDRIAMIDAETGEFWTYQELLSRSLATAQTLQQRGFQRHDLVALCSNKANFNAVVPLLAAQFLGCISYSIDPILSVEDCVELLGQVPPKVIFVVPEAKDKITASLKQLNFTSTEVVTFGEQFKKEFLMKTVEDFEPVHIESLRETCMIHFSSGTTSTPKSICINHYYIMAMSFLANKAISNLSQSQYKGHPVGAMHFMCTNYYWVSSTIELYFTLSRGGCRLLCDKFNTAKFWTYLEKYRIKNAFLMPLTCIELAESEKPEHLDVSSLNNIMSGTYKLNKEFKEGLRELLPDALISEAYAMTECGFVSIFNPISPEHKRFLLAKSESVGIPCDGLLLKVVDIETGKKCGPNQPGLLFVKGKQVFTDFYNKDSSESFDDQGFFNTGDLVYFDEDFCFYFSDRIKNIIRWCDQFIFLDHVERVILSHPAVHHATIIGIPHKREGERLMGVVQLKKGYHEDISEQELVEYVNSRVEDRKRLREGVKFVEQLPYTITGKLNRLKLKQMILDEDRAGKSL